MSSLRPTDRDDADRERSQFGGSGDGDGAGRENSGLVDPGDPDDRASGVFLRDYLQRHSVPLVDNDELIRNVQEAIEDRPTESGGPNVVDARDGEIAGEHSDPPGVLDG